MPEIGASNKVTCSDNLSTRFMVLRTFCFKIWKVPDPPHRLMRFFHPFQGIPIELVVTTTTQVDGPQGLLYANGCEFNWASGHVRHHLLLAHL
jgi:hypothetical protein